VIYLAVKLFIVRHGSTDQLEGNQRQTNDSKLSNQGFNQVRKIGNRLVKTDIDYFFCSPLKRTEETSEEISKLIGKKYILDPRLREVDHPKKLYGAKLTDEIVKKYDREKLNWLDNLDWKFLNEGESLRDVINRTMDFKDELISKYIDKNVLIVSHAYAIRCFISGCILGNTYTNEAMLRTVHAVRISKASLSELEYLAENKYFYVNLLNDVTHLGEK